MKEKIYTIPVMDGYKEDCECPLCKIEKKLEDEALEYFLCGAHMEVDGRAETNENGFCAKHLEMMFNSKKNALGLGLILSTWIATVENEMEQVSSKFTVAKKGGIFSKAKTENGLVEAMTELLTQKEESCTICNRMKEAMDDYVDTVFYLWKKEPEFRELFKSKKGYCQKHFKMLLTNAPKKLSAKDNEEFVKILVDQQQENLKRLINDVLWFTEKFDYRNNDKPWGTSKDALQRCIYKMVGNTELNQ